MVQAQGQPQAQGHGKDTKFRLLNRIPGGNATSSHQQQQQQQYYLSGSSQSELERELARALASMHPTGSRAKGQEKKRTGTGKGKGRGTDSRGPAASFRKKADDLRRTTQGSAMAQQQLLSGRYAGAGPGTGTHPSHSMLST